MSGAWSQTPAAAWASLARAQPKRHIKLELVALVAAVGVHAVALWALVLPADAPSPKSVSAPLMVSLMAPRPEPKTESKPEPKPQPKIETAKPKSRPTPTAKPLEQLAVSEPIAAASAPPSVTKTVAEAEPQPVIAAKFDADYLNNPAPKYPPLARRLKEQGVVLVRVHVLPSGDPGAVELKQSSGSERLDQAAVDVVRHWRFVPAKQGGDAIAAWVVVPISFSLGA